jgi:hypothetical protein
MKIFAVHLLLIRDVNVQQIIDVDVVIKQLNTNQLGNRMVVLGRRCSLPALTLFLMWL